MGGSFLPHVNRKSTVYTCHYDTHLAGYVLNLLTLVPGTFIDKGRPRADGKKERKIIIIKKI